MKPLLLAGLLAGALGALSFRATRASTPGIRVSPGETVTGSKAGAGVPVVLPGGASGRTVWPVRGMKTPHATVFLDPAYFAGYPNSAGQPTQPALKGYHHPGLDVNGPGACNADQGDALYAVRDGVIEFVGNGGGSWGLVIVLRFMVDGRTWWARYGHCQVKGKDGKSVTVKVGQSVRAGDVISHIGRGSWPCAHLHFDIFHAKPPVWGWWPLRNADRSTVTRYCTDPDAFMRRLAAVAP